MESVFPTSGNGRTTHPSQKPGSPSQPTSKCIPFRALLMLEGRCYSLTWKKCKGPSNWSPCPWYVNRISFHKHQSWHNHGLKSHWLSMASDVKPKTPSYHLSSSILPWILLFSWISTGLQMPSDAPFSPAFPDTPSPACELPLRSHHPFLNLRLQSHGNDAGFHVYLLHQEKAPEVQGVHLWIYDTKWLQPWN